MIMHNRRGKSILGLVFAVMLSIFSVTSQAKCITNDSWTGPDKVKHALVGAGVGAGTTLVFKEPEYGVLATVFVAGAKELYDRRGRGTCSLQDFAVTVAAGTAASYGVAWFIAPVKDGVVVGYTKKF